MVTKTQQQVSRALIGYCSVLWLSGSLLVAQGNLTAQWTGTHCPNGQAQSSQHSHSHCTWHCGGLDIQSGGGRGVSSTINYVSRVWSLGVIPLPDAALDDEFPPRGPPRGGLEIA